MPVPMSEINPVLDAFRACKTLTEVNTTAVHYAKFVVKLDKGCEVDRTMAIWIKNLAKYQRMILR